MFQTTILQINRILKIIMHIKAKNEYNGSKKVTTNLFIFHDFQ